MRVKVFCIILMMIVLIGGQHGSADQGLVNITDFLVQIKENEESFVDRGISIYVPDVYSLPVLRVELKDTKSFGERYLRGCFSVINLNYEKYQLAEKRGKGTYPVQTYSPIHGSGDNTYLMEVYASNQDESAFGMIDTFKERILEFDGDSERGVLVHSLSVNSPWRSYDDSTDSFGDILSCGELTGIGGYSISGYPVLHGIPVISSVGLAYEESASPKVSLRRVMREECSYSMNYYADDFFAFSGIGIWDEVKIVRDNLPILNAESLQSKVYDYFEETKNANILSFSLGYVVYMDKDEKYFTDERIRDNRFLAIPTWCAQVQFGGERNDPVRLVMFNAQTGDVYDRKSKSIEDWFAPTLL